MSEGLIGNSYNWLFDRSKMFFGVQEILPPTSVSVLTTPGGESTNNLTVSDLFEEKKIEKKKFKKINTKKYHYLSEYESISIFFLYICISFYWQFQNLDVW